MSEYRYPVKVQIEDTDFGGVVYHANYLKYFERARSQWLEDLGVTIQEQEAEDYFFTVHDVVTKFIAPARLADQLEVVSKVIKIKRFSISFEQVLYQKQNPHVILNTAQVKIACIDKTFKLKPIPNKLVQELSSVSE